MIWEFRNRDLTDKSHIHSLQAYLNLHVRVMMGTDGLSIGWWHLYILRYVRVGWRMMLISVAYIFCIHDTIHTTTLNMNSPLYEFTVAQE